MKTPATLTMVTLSILFAVFFAGCATRPDPELVSLAQQTYPSAQPYANSNFFPFDGATIHYRVWESTGQPDTATPGILLIHGLGASTFSWRYTAPELAQQGYTVVAVDLPAFGYTSRNPGARWTDGQRSTALWSMVQQEFPEISQWILVGHSYGGRITLRMAVDEPGLSAGWVGVSPAIGEGGRRIALLRFWPFRQIARAFIGSRFQKPQGLAGTLENAYGRDPSEQEIMGYLAPFLLPGAIDGFIDFTLVKNPQERKNAQGDITESSSIELIPLLQAPGLLIWGQDDQWVGIDQADGILTRKSMPLMVIEGAGHVAQETHALDVSQKILAWLELIKEL